MVPLSAAISAGSFLAKTAVTEAGVELAKTAGRALMSTVITASQNGSAINSLADLTRPARVEPLVIIDQTLVDQPIMLPVMKMAASSYAAYYLQAVNIIMGVGRIDTLKVLDRLNPERSLMGDIGGMFDKHKPVPTKVANESVYADGLPSLEAFVQPLQERLLFSMEADSTNPNKKEEDKKLPTISAGEAKAFEIDNLIVGKLLNVSISDGKQEGKLPVLIRMVPTSVPPVSLVHMFSAGGRDNWGQRLFMVSTKQIKFWRDAVFGIDMIDEHFAALMADKSGTLKAITERRRNNNVAAARTGAISLADASNIAIISSDTIKKASGKLLGRIEDRAVRQTIFDNTFLLMLIVVDERWERVQIWHRGIDMATVHRFDEVEKSEKSKGPDITDLFKMIGRNMQTNIG
jgi:hypothetical protein